MPLADRARAAYRAVAEREAQSEEDRAALIKLDRDVNQAAPDITRALEMVFSLPSDSAVFMGVPPIVLERFDETESLRMGFHAAFTRGIQVPEDGSGVQLLTYLVADGLCFRGKTLHWTDSALDDHEIRLVGWDGSNFVDEQVAVLPLAERPDPEEGYREAEIRLGEILCDPKFGDVQWDAAIVVGALVEGKLLPKTALERLGSEERSIVHS